MLFNTQAEKIGLLLNVIDNPSASMPAVRNAVKQIAESRQARRPVIFEGMLFSSIVDAAHYVCYAYDRRVYNWHQHVRYDRINRDVTKMKTSFVYLVRTMLKQNDVNICFAPSANMNEWSGEFTHKVYKDYGAIRDMTDYNGRWM